MRGGLAIAIVIVAALLALPAGEAAAACDIAGTAGSDLLRGTKQAEVICARGGADEVFGGGGADVIKGGSGSDELAGGAGADRLLGGAGRDSCRDRDAGTRVRGCERFRGPLGPPGVGIACCFGLPEPPDLTAPQLLGIRFDEPFVDTSSTGSIGLDVIASDFPSGLGRVEARLRGPGGPWRELTFESAQPHSGVASASVEVPATTPGGRYRVSGLALTDRAGNRVSFDAEALEQAGFGAGFDVFEGPDEVGPELTDFSISPASLDTSAGPGSVQFSLTATDDLSGVEHAAALIRLPGSDPPLCFPCGRGASSSLAAGTIYDGVWEESFPLPRFAMPGTYLLTAVVLEDRAGNRTTYNPGELQGLGLPTEFSQTGAGDTEPPEILDFWMDPDTLQTSKGTGTIDFFIHVEDDLSGLGETSASVFGELRVDFQPPLAFGWGYTDGGTTQISGTSLGGVWRFRKILPPDAETGTWTIPAIAAEDHAGNLTLLREDELEATGWDLTFENLP